MKDFIRDHNIANYVERLHMEEDGATRGTLQRLLIEEEDAFARASEKVETLDRLIAESEQRIDRMNAVTSANGLTPLAERLLQNSSDLVFILKTLRIQAEREADKKHP